MMSHDRYFVYCKYDTIEHHPQPRSHKTDTVTRTKTDLCAYIMHVPPMIRFPVLRAPPVTSQKTHFCVAVGVLLLETKSADGRLLGLTDECADVRSGVGDRSVPQDTAANL